MKQLKNIEIKQELTKLLKHFHDFCVGNNLNYSIAYGTLLGAHRHKGFIPWDDDIDVVMPEEDYIKLLNTYKNSEEFSLKEIHLCKNYAYPYAKLNLNTTLIKSSFEEKKEQLGLYLDIFPIYKSNPTIINSNIDTFHKFARSVVLRKFDSNVHNFKTLIKAIISKFIFPSAKHNRKIIIKKTDKLINKFKDTTFDTYHQFVWIGYEDVLYSFKYEQFENKKLIKFENIQVYAIADYQNFLEVAYGPTYNELPPEEKRVSHNIIAFYK